MLRALTRHATLSYLHWKAGRLYGRGNFASARPLYARTVALEPADKFALWVLAMCLEHEGQAFEALRVLDRAVQIDPDWLPTLQLGSRLAVALGEHEQAARYIRRALTLSEVITEIPQHITGYNRFARFLRIFSRLPIVRRRIRAERLADTLRHLDSGDRAVALKEWKRWAQEYLAWHEGDEPPPGPAPFH